MNRIIVHYRIVVHESIHRNLSNRTALIESSYMNRIVVHESNRRTLSNRSAWIESSYMFESSYMIRIIVHVRIVVHESNRRTWIESSYMYRIVVHQSNPILFRRRYQHSKTFPRCLYMYPTAESAFVRANHKHFGSLFKILFGLVSFLPSSQHVAAKMASISNKIEVSSLFDN